MEPRLYSNDTVRMVRGVSPGEEGSVRICETGMF